MLRAWLTSVGLRNNGPFNINVVVSTDQLPIEFWAQGYKINPGRHILNAFILSHSEKKKTLIQEDKNDTRLLFYASNPQILSEIKGEMVLITTIRQWFLTSIHEWRVLGDLKLCAKLGTVENLFLLRKMVAFTRFSENPVTQQRSEPPPWKVNI